MEFLAPLGLLVMTVALTLAALGRLSPWLPRRMVRWTARRLRDEEAIERFLEEWQAELESIPGGHSQLWFAFGRVLSLPLMLREQRTLMGSGKGTRGFSADEFLELTEQFWGRLEAYGIDHFVVVNHGEHILVHLVDGRVETVEEPRALEALLDDLRNYAHRNGFEPPQVKR